MGMTQPVRSSLVTVDPVPRRTASLCLVLIRPTFYSIVIEQLSTLGILISIPKSSSEYLTTLEYKL